MFRSSSTNCGAARCRRNCQLKCRQGRFPATLLVLYPFRKGVFLAKIAVELEQALKRRALSGAPPHTVARRLGEGNGRTGSAVGCTSRPPNGPFAKRCLHVCLAIVPAGRFSDGTSVSRAVVSPG